ncbi:MAG: outer membrane protein assembly factor BamD [Hydrogenothermaceae bacterium]|nr:outer membrane protein assembly factor BamD [Hydrogenothermaceae bacterium]
MKKVIFVLVSVAVASCGGKKEAIFEGQKTYNTGLELYQKGDYKKAKEELKKAIFKSEGLTTQQILEARFALADSYYHREEYIDAIAEFEEFIMLYPTSDKIPEALYKLAMSYMIISPDYRRDLTYVKKAQEKAEEIIYNYPNSKFVGAAKEIIKKANEIKAKHTLYIAETYEKYGKPYSASVYYSEAYENYKDYIEADYVAYKLAYNLMRVDFQYYTEVENYKNKIKELEKQISVEKDIDKKNAFINRKKVLEDHIQVLKDRIEKSRDRAKEIIALFPKAFPNSPYLSKLKEVEKESKIDNFLKKINIFD